MCRFQNLAEATSDDCSFVVHKGPAWLAGSTGPSSDHTLQNSDGGYLYFQASKCVGSAPLGLVTLVSTQEIGVNPRESAQCLQFWYHMFGAPNVFIVLATFCEFF